MKRHSRLLDWLLILVAVSVGCGVWWWRQEPVNPLVGSWRVKSMADTVVVFERDGSLSVFEKGKLDQKASYRANFATRPAQLDVSINRHGAIGREGTEIYRMICEITPKGQLRVQDGVPKGTRPTDFTDKADVMEREPAP